MQSKENQCVVASRGMRLTSLWWLLCRYENPEIALNCGMMLRECVRHEPLCKIVLYSEEFYSFFGFVEVSTFDIASDAFSTFKVGCLDNGGWVLAPHEFTPEIRPPS